MRVTIFILVIFLSCESFAQIRVIMSAVYKKSDEMLITLSTLSEEEMVIIVVPGKVVHDSLKPLNHLYLESLRKYTSPLVSEYVKKGNSCHRASL